MTIWDKIYKNFQQGGDAWATLSEDINPVFIDFVTHTKFRNKYALDIGCGTGKYLKYLQQFGFKTDGIDSSGTAVEMTKKILDDNSVILAANMFEFEIPKEKYDLIISLSTIHHGTKDQVKCLIDKIYDAIVVDGNIFVTLPDFESSKKWDTFKNHEEIADGTFSPLSGPEKGLPHSFYSKAEIESLFSHFQQPLIELDKIGRWIIRGVK